MAEQCETAIRESQVTNSKHPRPTKDRLVACVTNFSGYTMYLCMISGG